MLTLKINQNNKKGHINKEIYGNFSEHLGRCIYEGIYVGDNSQIPNVNGMRVDVVEALKAINLPVLRWPGGCFADEYHWMDGIGPKEKRKKMINTHWGGVVEDNSFGTHEFMELCAQVGCEPYINANVGSGTVREMSEWVEYLTFDGLSPMAALREENGQKDPWKVKYLGVGNENWGCGGNMTAEYYANEYRRYSTYCRNYGENKLYRIACGPNSDDYHWTDTLMKVAGNHMDGLSLHYYTIPTGNWSDKGNATGFTSKEWYSTLKKTLYMEELVTRHSAIMDQYDNNKRVGLLVDEWGTWYNVEEGTNPGFLYQQNTIRDAVVAAINLNIFNKHCDRVKMANIAQLVNVLQSLILTEGGKMVLTPTYYVFKLYKDHQEGTLLDSHICSKEIGDEDNKVPQVHESVSEAEDGTIHITLTNLSAEEATDIETEIMDKKITIAEGEVLAGAMGAYNTFEAPDVVKPVKLEALKLENNRLILTLPACSVAHITVKVQ